MAQPGLALVLPEWTRGVGVAFADVWEAPAALASYPIRPVMQASLQATLELVKRGSVALNSAVITHGIVAWIPETRVGAVAMRVPKPTTGRWMIAVTVVAIILANTTL